jgi:hypothetical protein
LDSRIGADEDPYAYYVYLIDVENMRDALLKAEESVPTDKQQPQETPLFDHGAYAIAPDFSK